MTSSPTTAAAHVPQLMRLATVAAMGVALLLVAAKTFAYFETHSVALLSSLADSALDVLASGLNLLAVRQSLVPADAHHRFGHGKAEPLSALAQGAFIGGSAVLVAWRRSRDSAGQRRSPGAISALR